MNDMILTINGKSYKLVPTDEQLEERLNTPSVHQDTNRHITAYVCQLVNELQASGRHRTSETYRSALNSLLRYLAGNDIQLCDINGALMCDYERYLRARGVSSNSASFYLRVLRTIYNRAVTEGLVIDRKPFARVYTGIGKTSKRAVPLDIIKRINNMDRLSPAQAFARDIFLFSFYTRGMSFVDIAYLRPGNIKCGMLTYRRHKTGQELTMRMEPQIQEIIDRNPSPNPDYLLPIIKRSNGCERSQYRESQRMVNCMLHDIGCRLQLTSKLTFYCARHSWASIAHTMNIPLPIISEGMGHSSERTTRIYLKSLDHNRIDSLNASIIQAVDE